MRFGAGWLTWKSACASSYWVRTSMASVSNFCRASTALYSGSSRSNELRPFARSAGLLVRRLGGWPQGTAIPRGRAIPRACGAHSMCAGGMLNARAAGTTASRHRSCRPPSDLAIVSRESLRCVCLRENAMPTSPPTAAARASPGNGGIAHGAAADGKRSMGPGAGSSRWAKRRRGRMRARRRAAPHRRHQRSARSLQGVHFARWW